jgi:hypothetical protein
MSLNFFRKISTLDVIKAAQIIVNSIQDIHKALNIKEISFLIWFNLRLKMVTVKNSELLLDVQIKKLIFLKHKKLRE